MEEEAVVVAEALESLSTAESSNPNPTETTQQQ